MIKHLTLIVLTVLSPLCAAKVISTPGKPIIAIDGGSMGTRVCYYQDQAYSEGALLQVGERYMTCQKANDFESNSALKWMSLEESELDAQSQKSSLPKRTISVN